MVQGGEGGGQRTRQVFMHLGDAVTLGTRRLLLPAMSQAHKQASLPLKALLAETHAAG